MMELVASPVLFLISAPSGAGKTTVGQELLRTVPGLERAITCTTRAAREGERDGIDYHFLEVPAFERRLAAGEFLEHARVYANLYGTLRSEVLNRLSAGADVLLTVDVQGAAAIRRTAAADPTLGPSLVSVFLMPPSVAELRRRLCGRNQDSAEVIDRRLGMAREEMGRWREFDHVVVSGTVSEDLARMQCILEAERLRTSRIRSLTID